MTKKIKRWKKGQSCVTNPESNTHRSRAKNRFFSSTGGGQSRLTVAAVEKHEVAEAESDLMLHDIDSLSIGGRSTKTATTWATSFTDCANTSFTQVLRRYSTSSLAAHREVLAVLAATADVIRAQGGKESDTEYFALLMSSLDSDTLQGDESIAAALYLLSIVIKRVPEAVLKSSFSNTSKVLLKILATKSDAAVSSIFRSIIVCLTQLLKLQSLAVWSMEETKQVYQSLLVMALSSKAKVRKSAQQAVKVILGTLMQSHDADHHPAITQTATFCIAKLRETRGNSSNPTATLHLLEFLRVNLATFPKSNLKTVCECIVQMLTLSHVLLREVALKTLDSLFSSKPKVDNLPADYNAKIITVLYEYKPNDVDIHQTETWLNAMVSAHCNLARLDPSLSLSHLPRLFESAVKCLQTTSLAKSAARALCVLIAECIEPARDVIRKQMAVARNQSCIQKVFRCVESGLGYQYFASWDLVLVVLTRFYEVLGRECHVMMTKSLKSLAELRGSPGFQHKDLAEKAIGMCIKAMGPEVVLQVIPLEITGDGSENFSQSWLLPLLRDHIEGTRLAFFISYFIPLADKVEKKCVEFENAKRMGELKVYETVYNQIWCLLPSFCNKPTDTAESFPQLAKKLGMVIRDKASVRLEMLASLRKVIVQSEGIVDEREVVSRYAQNFLPILFNLYVSQTADTKDASVRAVLETIKVYFKVADQTLVNQYSEKCYEKLSNVDIELSQRYLLMDIVINLVKFLDESWLSKFLAYALGQLKSSNKTYEKKSYRLIEELLAGDSSACRSVVQDELGVIQEKLVESLSSSSPSAMAPRLRCLLLLFRRLSVPCDQLMTDVMPEVILCTKATAVKARTAAFALLVELGQVSIRWYGGHAEKDAISSYMVKLMVGLTSNSQHMMACTVIALTKVMFDFKALIDLHILGPVVDSAETLLTSNSREVVQATLGLVKAVLSAFGETVFSHFLQRILASVTSLKKPMRMHFRTKIKDFFTRLIRKFGYEVVVNLVPEGERKILSNIQKSLERAKRQKSRTADDDEEDDDDEISIKHKPENIDDILQESDSDMDSGESTANKLKVKANLGKDEKRKKGAWLKEDDDIVDFMDSSAIKKVITTTPERSTGARRERVKQFKMAADGRLVITESEKEEKTGHKAKVLDDLDQLLLSNDSKTPKYGKRKRAKNDDDETFNEDDDGDSRQMKYKAGGSGIHRTINKTAAEVKKTSKQLEAKVTTDGRKKAKLDPYAYVPLKFQSLNKRKMAKSSGQFKNLVKGAKRGAEKGAKHGSSKGSKHKKNTHGM